MDEHLEFHTVLIVWDGSVFLNSRHVNTICWILELFYMMSWKYSPKEVLGNADFRKELHT